MYKWLNYQIVAPQDRFNLERASHILEQFHNMPSDIAEAVAYEKYLRQQHAKAAGFHLMGMISNKENHRDEESKKHCAMYTLHLQAMNLPVTGPVSAEIMAQKPIDWPFDCFVDAEGDVLLKSRQISSDSL